MCARRLSGGIHGVGKSTIAHALADRLGWHYIDLDAEIEAAEQTTIAELFEARGEPEFRRIETEALKKVMHRIERGMPSVIALGGGSFVQPANAKMLKGHGVSIWLDCPFEILSARITGAVDGDPGHLRATASGSGSSMMTAAPPMRWPTTALMPIVTWSGQWI